MNASLPSFTLPVLPGNLTVANQKFPEGYPLIFASLTTLHLNIYNPGPQVLSINLTSSNI